ncbi:hypothetical protein [Tenacibaculum sp. Bg11-29]|uniref:hypothetical protein n=1 Tax=Tenacibaculum sp. Bg11-29 TaxID=2058306 RepID=UPI0012FEEF60|nr:hypothetical protein [Tenacibaculum sp. Bg11-29]
MLKNISNLGSVLNKTEQQSINGGKFTRSACYNMACPPPSPGCRCLITSNTICEQECF